MSDFDIPGLSPVLDNADYVQGKTTGGTTFSLIGLSAANVVSIDPSAIGAVFGGGITSGSSVIVQSGTVSVGSSITRRGNATYPGAADDLSPSTLSLANLGTVAIADATGIGFVVIVDNNTGATAIAWIGGGLHSTSIPITASGTWGTTAGASNNFNVYWDAGTSKYRIENRSGGVAGLMVYRLGQMTS